MNHPAIIDNTQPTTPFLDWVAQRGYSVVLTTENAWVVATLVGTQQVTYRDGGFLFSFKGYGHSREDAVAALARECSGRKHAPRARKGWFGFVIAGPEEQFPSFVAP